MNKPALLVLEDGSVFYGLSIGVDGVSVGEVVFNTAMTGYQEILTDPSYAQQLVTLTYPHIGNVGVNAEDVESGQVFCSGLIVKNVPKRHSNWRAQYSLTDFLRLKKVVAISAIDTRRLTRLIRKHGTQKACIVAGESADVEQSIAQALQAASRFPGLAGMDLAKVVSTPDSYSWREGEWSLRAGYQAIPQNSPHKFKVVAYDFGVKHNILRMLAQRGCEVTVVPAQTAAKEVLKLSVDGVFLSNGPGDPEPCTYAIEAITEILKTRIPLFGICLGHQLMALASGAKTEKMKFGHHGANHPVQDLDTGAVVITSQNHGFTVREESLNASLRVTHRSLFDSTIQGLERTDVPAFSFQGHPEASPGAKDIGYLFDKFIAMMACQSEVKNA